MQITTEIRSRTTPGPVTIRRPIPKPSLASLRWWIAADSYRSDSEDRAEVWQVADGLVVAVADGVGGMGAGARAASLVIGRVGTIVQRAVDVPDGGRRVARLLAELDPDIEADLDAGEATAVVVAIGRLDITGASSGDSSAWFVTADRVDDLTEYQHRKRRIGSGLALPVTFERPLQPGWLVVGTDGLFDTVRQESIIEVLSEGPADPARALIRLAQGRTGRLPDDVAVVVVRVG